MKKLVLSGLLLFSAVANAQTVKVINVNCNPPPMMAGGVSVSLRGQVKIMISPTTGMTKVAPGSTLALKVGNSAPITIPFDGTYYELGANTRIEGSVDSDDRNFSTIQIYFNDSPDQMRSYIQRLNGDHIPMFCSR